MQSSTEQPVPKPKRRWLRATLRLLLITIILVLLAGFLYENISEARDRRFHPMPGQLVDIGGYKLHLHCVGQGTPVILDSGLGDSYISWRKVQPEISKFARVCSYDRAGLGYSEPSPHPRTSRAIAEELHTLLDRAQVPRPIIIVGHSMGGYDIRLYANLYPKEVIGMVFVDASHPDQARRLPPAIQQMQSTWLRDAELLAYTMPLGIPRLMGTCDPDPAVRALECNSHSAREAIAEMKAFNESAAQAATTGPFGDIPLAVLSHDPDRPSSELPADVAKATNEAWEKMQEDLAHLSTHGTQTIAKGSDHYIQLDRPDVVIEAIKKIQFELASTSLPEGK
jgi:pimeloyl-ACP methyl ester carboxylesterase